MCLARGVLLTPKGKGGPLMGRGGGGRASIYHIPYKYTHTHTWCIRRSPAPTLRQLVHLGAGLGNPPLYFEVRKHKNHVLEVNWIVFRGYLP